MITDRKNINGLAFYLIFIFVPAFVLSGCEEPPTGDWRGKLYWANIFHNKIFQANPDGSDRVTFAKTATWPDAVVVDEKNGLMYWTNMGDVEGTALNGTIQRCQMDNCIETTMTIVDKNNTATPKQLSLDRINGYIYWADRDRDLIQRCSLDGADVETVLVLKGQSELKPVGCEIDEEENFLYWSEKKSNRIGRVQLSNVSLPYVPQEKDYIVKSNLAGPTEIKTDKIRRKLFIAELSGRISSVEIGGGIPTPIVNQGLSQPAGLALDRENGVIFVSELNEEDINRVDMDGTNFKVICKSGGLYTTGMFFVPKN